MYVVTLSQRGQRGEWPAASRSFPFAVSHCVTVGQAVRTAQRAYPGWTVVYVEDRRR